MRQRIIVGSRHTARWLVAGLGWALLLAGAADAANVASSTPGEPLSPTRLVREALVASGVEDAERIAELENRFEQLCDKFDHQVGTAIRPPESAAADVHRFLHEQVLTGEYDAACSRVDRTLDEGVYNCVTATVLFHAFCRHRSIEPRAVVCRSHVFSRLPEASLDVETTCAAWRDASFRTGQRTSDEAGEREIDDRRLIGKIYFNRGVELLDRRDYASALQLIRTSLQWDANDPSARENLLAGLNNWALAECEAGRFEAAAELVDEGLALDGSYGPLRANDLHVRQCWAVNLCDRGEFARARDVLQEGFQRRPEVPLFAAGRLVVYRSWARSLLLGGRIREGLAVVNEAQRAMGDRPPAAECLSRTLAECIRELRKAGRMAEAEQLSLALSGPLSTLEGI